jgi:hypothetical protein
MKMFLLVVLVVGIVTGAGAALADPNLSNVSPHRHYIRTPTGALIQVGPRVCDNPALQAAFNQFHNNLHISSGHGPAAPGLHNGTGAEITAGPC